MLFNKPTDQGAALRSVAGGVLLAMCFIYLLVYFPEIVRGIHQPDLNLLRALALIGIAVIGFGAWENQGLES